MVSSVLWVNYSVQNGTHLTHWDSSFGCCKDDFQEIFKCREEHRRQTTRTALKCYSAIFAFAVGVFSKYSFKLITNWGNVFTCCMDDLHQTVVLYNCSVKYSYRYCFSLAKHRTSSVEWSAFISCFQEAAVRNHQQCEYTYMHIPLFLSFSVNSNGVA